MSHREDLELPSLLTRPIIVLAMRATAILQPTFGQLVGSHIVVVGRGLSDYFHLFLLTRLWLRLFSFWLLNSVLVDDKGRDRGSMLKDYYLGIYLV